MLRRLQLRAACSDFPRFVVVDVIVDSFYDTVTYSSADPGDSEHRIPCNSTCLVSHVTDSMWNNEQNVAGLFFDSSDGFTFNRPDHSNPAVASKGVYLVTIGLDAFVVVTVFFTLSMLVEVHRY